MHHKQQIKQKQIVRNQGRGTFGGESSDDESRGSLGVNQIIGSRSENVQQQIQEDQDSDGSDFEHLEDVRRTGDNDVVENKFNLP